MKTENNSIINWELHQQKLEKSPIYTGPLDFRMKNKLDRQYQMLLQTILDHGIDKEDRTGTGTRSIFGYTIRHNMADGFPLLTTKKMFFKGIITELIWFLQGNTNIKYLVDNDCHIWDGDAYKKYQTETKREIELNNTMELHPDYGLTQEEFVNRIKANEGFAKRWGDLGPIYGKQWRSWEGLNSNTDQIANLINDLKNNPDSRRIMVNAWNPAELDQMTLPPCHYGFQVYTRPTTRKEKITNPGKYRAISLMWNQRSVDTFLGLPFNIASYGLLLMMIADEVNMIPDQLIGNLGDTHIYNNHIDQVKEQISRTPFELPTVHVRDGIFCSSHNDVILVDYHSHPAIKAPLSN
jgi:thymidylate synthase